LSIIIDATGAGSYHGFLPVVMRDCIQHMIGVLLLECASIYECGNYKTDCPLCCSELCYSW